MNELDKDLIIEFMEEVMGFTDVYIDDDTKPFWVNYTSSEGNLQMEVEVLVEFAKKLSRVLY